MLQMPGPPTTNLLQAPWQEGPSALEPCLKLARHAAAHHHAAPCLHLWMHLDALPLTPCLMLTMLQAAAGHSKLQAGGLLLQAPLRHPLPMLQAEWRHIMVQYMRRNAERSANLFVVNATSPAQLFHVLRRQMNR